MCATARRKANGVWQYSGASAVVFCVAVVLAAAPQAQSRANQARGCIDRFDAAADYFPDKATIDDAVNFSVDYRKSYKVITVKRVTAGGPAEKYVLVQCGAPAPKLEGDLAGAQVVTVPIPTLFVFSTTQLPLLVDLGRVEVITGVAELQIVDTPSLQERIRAGKVVEFAKGLTIDAERVVASKPALLMAGGVASSTLTVIRSAGIPVVDNTEWQEPTALARAEWLKYVALFLNEERKATTLYGAMKDRYRAVSTKATAEPPSTWPSVMTGRSTRGTFVIAGGRSYVAAMIHDAGGRYVWAGNTATGAPSVDLEAQIRRAGEADFWINGGGWKNRAAMLEDEPRYAQFKAFRNGQVWVYERRQTPTGANDYWSRSVSHPDLVLSDLVKIFHPALMRDHQFEWYMTVPDR